jgi:hypothetical protein
VIDEFSVERLNLSDIRDEYECQMKALSEFIMANLYGEPSLAHALELAQAAHHASYAAWTLIRETIDALPRTDQQGTVLKLAVRCSPEHQPVDLEINKVDESPPEQEPQDAK